jgi:hypothetical protein
MSAVGRELTMHGLGDDEPDVMCEAVRKPLMPVRRGIGMTERGLHPDVAHNELPLRLQLLKAHRQREFLVRRVHEHTSPSRLFGVAAGTPIKRQHRHPLAQTRKVAVIQGLRETRSITFPRYIYGLRS